MATVNGAVAPRFEAVRDLLQTSIDNGDDAGASVCAIHDGEMIVDLWGGVADAETGEPWERDTIVNVFSVTKTMVALAALLLIDRGELDPDAPVARYWPEFAAAGKADVLVRHLLGHTSGLPGWQVRVTLDDIYDTERASALLAAQEPWWRPGDGSGYQAMNHGHLIGPVVQRIYGASLGQLIATELAGPLGADFYLGTPADVDDRVGRLIPPPSSDVDWSRVRGDSLIRKVLLNPVLDVRRTAEHAWRAAEMGAMNGHGNARSVAALQALISHGGDVGTGPKIRPATIDRVFETQSDTVDRVLGLPLRLGLGYGLVGGVVPLAGRICWWSGYGGSLVINDLDKRLTVAYVMNKMAPALVGFERAARYVAAIDAELS